jgi:hypothetical protein
MKLYMFRTVPLSIIRSFPLHTQQWYKSYRFADSFRAGSGWNFHPDPAVKTLHHTYGHKPVKIVEKNNSCLFSDRNKTQKMDFYKVKQFTLF